MGRILDYIEKSGGGKYVCYKTKKLSLDYNDNDTLAYEDKPVSQFKKSVFAETDQTRKQTVRITGTLIENTPPIFRYFLDGSRHTYKVDDIAIGKRIFPIVAGQVIVGCCERKGRDEFKKYDILQKLIMSLPDDFDDDDGGENFCRLYCENINADLANIHFVKERGLKIAGLLLYKTDGNSEFGQGKDNFINRAVAKIQAEMTDDEQLLVADLCKKNKLDDDSWLIKDGSLEYNPRFSNLETTQWNNLRSNYSHVVGISKSFDPELLADYEGNRLSKVIANLKPFERTKVYKYESSHNGNSFAVWYLRLRNKEYRETHFSDIVKCELVLHKEGELKDTDLINTISANIIREAYPVCYGADSRWANHLYPIFLTESFCKSNYIDSNIILSLF